MMIISEAWRMFKRNLKIKVSGLEKPLGSNDLEISKNIVHSCYNTDKKYFQVSPGNDSNYAVFYSRDFGWCTDALINIGYSEAVNNTLSYALNKYYVHNGISVAINPDGKPFNFPNVYSPDSVAYLFRSLRIAKAKSTILKYKDFLNAEIKRFEELVIDKEKCIIKNESFSGMRDYAVVKSSSYDMIMACMLSFEIDKINIILGRKILSNTLTKYSLKDNLVKNYWNGQYFINGINDESFAAHNNIYPYWLEIINDKKMLKSSLKEIIIRKLDNPIPTKYSADTPKTIWNAIFVPGWEHDTTWTMLGMAYIDTLSRINIRKAREHLKQYKSLIEKNGFVEVYEDIKPYQSLFYTSETRMIWAAMYINLKKRLDKK